MRKTANFAYVITVFASLALCSVAQAGEDQKDATLIPHASYAVDVTARSSSLYNQGSRRLNEGKYADALLLFEQAVKESRGNVDAWDHMGVCYRRLGQFDKAIQAYQTSISINPSNPVPYGNLGLIYGHMLKDYKQALSYYRKCLELAPTDPEGFYGAAQVYEAMKDHDQAIKNYDSALELYKKAQSPVIADAYYGLGLNYALKSPPDNIRAAKYFVEAKKAGRELPPQVKEFVSKVLGGSAAP